VHACLCGNNVDDAFDWWNHSVLLGTQRSGEKVSPFTS
jgi:hypothetical protein